MFGMSKAEREAKAEVETYLETCATTDRKYNAKTHVAKQCRASDKVNKSKGRK